MATGIAAVVIVVTVTRRGLAADEKLKGAVPVEVVKPPLLKFTLRTEEDMEAR